MKDLMQFLLGVARRLLEKATGFQREALQEFIAGGERLCQQWPGQSEDEVKQLSYEANRLLIVAHAAGIFQAATNEKNRRN